MNSVDASHQNRGLGDEQLDDGIVDTLILIETNVQWHLSCACGHVPFSQGPSRRPFSQILRKDRKDLGQVTDSRFVHLSFASDGLLTAQRR